jgi:hypothetical protein
MTMQANKDGYKRIAEILNEQKCEIKVYDAVDQQTGLIGGELTQELRKTKISNLGND